MNGIVLIHIGSKLPDYFYDCVEQIRKYYEGPIFTVIERSLAKVEDQQKYDTYIVPIDDFLKSECVREFEDVDVVSKHGEFWSLAFKRMFVLEDVMRKFELSEILHIENDVLIYEDPNKLNFLLLDQNFMHTTPVGPKYTTYAYCYIPNLKSIEFANHGNLDLLKLGYNTLSEKFQEGMVNEMLIAKELVDRGFINTLPILPTGETSLNLNLLGKLFDGASAGQFIGGTPGDDTPFMGRHHYVGTELLDKNISIEWKVNEYRKNPKVENGKVKTVDIVKYKEPYMRDDKTGISYKLCNLHIHSKNLKRWMS